MFDVECLETENVPPLLEALFSFLEEPCRNVSERVACNPRASTGAIFVRGKGIQSP